MKKMKKIILGILAVGLLFSCSKKPTETELPKAPIDSLIANWQNTWNNNDSAGICNMFAPDIVLIDDELVIMNSKELADNWAGPYHKLVKNLKTEKMQEWSSADRAGYTGKYELDIVINDSVIGHPHGIFTANWIKTENGEWKVTTANMNAFSDKPTQ